MEVKTQTIWTSITTTGKERSITLLSKWFFVDSSPISTFTKFVQTNSTKVTTNFERFLSSKFRQDTILQTSTSNLKEPRLERSSISSQVISSKLPKSFPDGWTSGVNHQIKRNNPHLMKKFRLIHFMMILLRTLSLQRLWRILVGSSRSAGIVSNSGNSGGRTIRRKNFGNKLKEW